MSAAADKVDVLAVLGRSRLETRVFASKAAISVPVARRLLRQAERSGLVTVELADSRYWRRGAAKPLIWRAAALAAQEPRHV